MFIFFLQVFLIISVAHQAISSFSLTNTLNEANDAAQYCIKKGGIIFKQNKSNITSNNAISYCIFKNGEKCNELIFYKTGKCEHRVGVRSLLGISKKKRDHLLKVKLAKYKRGKNKRKNKQTKVTQKRRKTQINITVTLFGFPDCKEKEPMLKLTTKYVDEQCAMNDCFDICDYHALYGTDNSIVKSIKVQGYGEIDLYETCTTTAGTTDPERLGYWATIMPLDGCVNIFSWPRLNHIRFKSPSILVQQSSYINDDGKEYHVVYSAESSTYFGYQVHAGYYGFLTSNQKDARYTRLLTSSEMDDLGDLVPSFHAKRHPFSKRYVPINKADVITKWYASPYEPLARVIVVIDPDNWLLQNLSPIVKQVKIGYAVAQAAFYHGWAEQKVKELWSIFCEINCDWNLDLASVPYFVHRDDLKVIAPLWKHYSIKIKQYDEAHPNFRIRFRQIQVDWCAEMFGYVFAAAHAGVKHEIMNNLQVRDVDNRPPLHQIPYIPMIHVGRAWLPDNYNPGKKWMHTEGKSFSHFGTQVWCKCNITANDILPWPIPPGTDFQSNATLTLLHNSRELFEKPPFNKFRSTNYHRTFP